MFLTRVIGITLCLLIVASATFAQKDKPTPPPPIIYTGKLIGYFRSPSLQTSEQIGCPSKDSPTTRENASNAAAVVLGTNLPENRILLGTGDNFSPQFEARTFSPAPKQSSSGAPADRFPPAQKELYSWFEEQNRWVFYTEVKKFTTLQDRIQRGINTIPSDNVACYLVAAGYDAVVPGKHDFYFGPERLRQLARFMADKQAPGSNPVQMLGANLVIKSSLINPPEVAADNKTLTDLRTTLDHLSKQDAYVCPAEKGRNDIKVDSTCKLNPANRTFRIIGDTVVADLGFDLPDDDRYILATAKKYAPAKHYGLALQSNPPANSPAKTCADKDVSCIRFSTRYPFFHFGDSTNNNHDPKPFVYLANKNAAIFGVVDPDLDEQVGVLNFSWKNVYQESSTVVSVEDPVEALQTQLDFFNRTHPQFNGIKILLAQMSPEHARALGAHFPEFQVVITAADGERSTSELDFSTTWVEGPHAKAFVAVPAPYYDPEQRDRFEGIVHLGRIDVTNATQFKQEKYVRNINQPAAWKLTSTLIAPQEVKLSKPVNMRASGADQIKTTDTGLAAAPESPNLNSSIPVSSALTNHAAQGGGGASDTFFKLIDDRFKKCQENSKADDYYNKIQQLTLCLMREQVSADVSC